VIRRTIPLTAAAAVFGISGYVINVALARRLGPDDYGSIGLVLSILSLANVVQASGVPIVVSRLVARDESRGGSIASVGSRTQLLVSTALAVVILTLSPALERGFDQDRLTTYLIIGVLMLPGFGAMAVSGGYWNGTHRFGRQAMVTIAYALSKLVLIIPLAHLWGIVGAIIGYAAAPFAAALVGRAGIPVAVRSDQPLDLLRPSLPLAAAAMTTLAMYSVDLYVVSASEATRDRIGYYVAAQTIALIPLTAASSFGQVAVPTVARLLSRAEPAVAVRAVREGLVQLLMVLVPACALLTILSPMVVRVLFGSEYAPANTPTRILVCAYGVVAVFSYLSSCIAGSGRVRGAVIGSLCGAAIAAGGGAILVVSHGLVGAAGALAIGALAASVIGWLALRAVIAQGHTSALTPAP